MLFKNFIALSILTTAIGCGSHDSQNQFYEKSGEIRRNEKITDPSDLMEAAIFDENLEAIGLLLAQGFDVNSILKKSQRVPLAEAVYRTRPRALRFLIQKSANIEKAIIEQTSLREWILKSQASPAALIRALDKTDQDDRDEAFNCIEKNDAKCLQSLFQEAVSPNLSNLDGETELTISIQKNKISMLRVLLSERSLNVNLRNAKGQSPLFLAKQNSMGSVVKELIKRNAED